MQETDSSGTTSTACKSTDNNTGNSSMCATFDKYGGATLVPGATSTGRTVRIYDTGTVDPAAFVLKPGACTVTGGIAGASGNICGLLTVTAFCTMSNAPTNVISIYDGSQTLSSIANTTKDLRALGCLPKTSGTYATMQFAVSLPSGADNTVQGQTASQPLTWQFIG